MNKRWTAAAVRWQFRNFGEPEIALIDDEQGLVPGTFTLEEAKTLAEDILEAINFANTFYEKEKENDNTTVA